jgi:hypothetical protein
VDLKINATKSAALRIGKRCNVIPADLNAQGEIINSVTEVKYLGLFIQRAQKFSCCFDKTKAKYYRAANAILGKLEKLSNVSITLHLIISIALPVLT